MVNLYPGSRDRSINLWPAHPQGPELKPLVKHPDAHQGWVWCFASQDDRLVSGAWDSFLKFWKVEILFCDRDVLFWSLKAFLFLFQLISTPFFKSFDLGTYLHIISTD